MGINLYPEAFAILFILLGVFLWKKGDKNEPFWAALLDVVSDIFIFDLPVFSTFRAWAVFFSVVGYGILILDIVGLIHYLFFK